jgi:hypothetical protein
MKDIEFLLWPTPKTGSNRNSKQAIVDERGGGKHKSDLSLEQAIEVINGVLPKELERPEQLPPRFYNMWPTPRSHEAGDYQYSQGDHDKPTATLSGAVKMWPTPGAELCGMTARTTGRPIEKSTHLQTQVYLAEKKMWLTTRAKMSHGFCRSRVENPQKAQAECRIEDMVAVESGMSGQLNPDWVETMVGLPIGWTNPDIKEVSRENPNHWPAFMGQPQYEWEPPRTCGKMPNRAKRLKMCGNICIAQQISPILHAIADIERSNHDRIA